MWTGRAKGSKKEHDGEERKDDRLRINKGKVQIELDEDEKKKMRDKCQIELD